ncbi:aminomethyl-transferring glycine dehydrogenase [Puniceicoccaceae bacterium K14]|nr:aminomethyl-transferring glycine dehydrogenase [Puniceicoccaceae bacterium K14]
MTDTATDTVISKADNNVSLTSLEKLDAFAPRHLGVSSAEATSMAQKIGFETVDALIDEAVPQSIRISEIPGLPKPTGESAMLAELKEIASKNEVRRSYIGLGYANTLTPTVILRNILENPGWYTQYTPYQAEISQGRMEALLNFQTMISDLTAMDIANASLLDEGTAAAEAMSMAHGIAGKKGRNTLLVSQDCYPQTIEILRTRAAPLNIDVQLVDFAESQDFSNAFAIVLQYPNTNGLLKNYSTIAAQAKENKALTIACCDLLSLLLYKAPGEWGADIAVGSAQRFGVPIGFGGPHAAFFATKDTHKRKIPGRIIGVSQDANGNPALRLALQTREQHIRRDKATSNICTAQVLLANIASAYAVYHGPHGLRNIAKRVQQLTAIAQAQLETWNYSIEKGVRFDTLSVSVSPTQCTTIKEKADELQINLRYSGDNLVGFTLDETVSANDIRDILNCFAPDAPIAINDLSKLEIATKDEAFERKSDFLTHPSFNKYHTETELLRYLKRLENKDLSLTSSMIPLGSCTMKLNATSEMVPVTWPEFGSIHPFAPKEQTDGYREMIEQLEDWLCKITGFQAVSLQPNAGSQGEYAGLLAIRAYHQSRGDNNRDLCIIPVSAHGTNPASAVMVGMKVLPVACDELGNIDVNDLKAKAEKHADNLAALMITYPSTHGVFESSIREICTIIHENGGQVYMDGANMNAQCGLTSPGEIGADVCHLNLHKTFCIPHGGGGPGVGPIGVAEHLKEFLPGHSLSDFKQTAVGAVSAAPYGSASILPISWAYIRMMGTEGLTDATKIAILNANYMSKRLEEHFPIVYRGESGLVAHEFIIDFREWKQRAGVEVEDIAKRLMDYGFHAPTMSWPVPGTMMIEPTESESKAELDRLCDALISIKSEMEKVESGEWPVDENPLKNAPHTSASVTKNEWDSPYSREVAAFPSPSSLEFKYWPSVGRVDNVYGDRNLVCSCLPMSDYAEDE